MWESRGAYRVLVGISEGRRPLGRPRRKWEDNIKMNLKRRELGGMDWIDLADERDRCHIPPQNGHLHSHHSVKIQASNRDLTSSNQATIAAFYLLSNSFTIFPPQAKYSSSYRQSC
jgi:hypothetical protein